MAKDEHNKAAEHHDNAAKSHRAAAEQHGKGDHARAAKLRGRGPGGPMVESGQITQMLRGEPSRVFCRAGPFATIGMETAATDLMG
jgi:hypothetical protein